MSTFLNQHFAGADGMKWWIGVVEDRNDPLQQGALRVRVHGYHVFDDSLIPTDELPWAFPVLPLTTGGVSGVGDTVGVMEGASVLGFWADWPDCQIPMVLGVLTQIEGVSTPGSSSSSVPNGGTAPQLHQDGNAVNDTVAGGPGTIKPTGDGPKWLQIARGELGTKEWPGPSHNPEVLKYGKDLGFTTDDSQHPWCAAFVRWCLKQAGCDVTGLTGMAKSPLKASCMEVIQTPIYGCVAVKHRSAAAANSTSGHTGFWVGRDAGKDKYLGGNQGDKVSIASFQLNAHAGYRWPRGQSKEFDSNGNVANDVTTSSQKQG